MERMISVGMTKHLQVKSSDGSLGSVMVTLEDGVWMISFTHETTQELAPAFLAEILEWFRVSGPADVMALQSPEREPDARYPTERPAQTIEIRTVERRGYVYVLHSAGVYKIGHSKEVNHRLSEIAPVMPYPVEIYLTIATEDRFILERDLHRRFANKRLNGEWFDLGAAELKYIESLSMQAR